MQQDYAGVLPHWFEVIAEMDALTSLANCNYNHPAWITPEVSQNTFAFNAKGMGHPLIDETRRISNSFQILNEERSSSLPGPIWLQKHLFTNRWSQYDTCFKRMQSLC